MAFSVSSEYAFLKSNYAEIRKDVEYFLAESKRVLDQEISKRFARAAIVFTAFYVESLANLMIHRIVATCGSNTVFENFISKKDDWPKPLRVFFGAYTVLKKRKLSKNTKKVWSLDTEVIKDLFLIRNQVLAHPPAHSNVGGTGVIPGKGLTQKGKHLSLKKFVHFPNIYTGFTFDHAEKIYKETRKFLEGYAELLAKSPNGKDLVSLFK